jgi:predicted dehydrogenase
VRVRTSPIAAVLGLGLIGRRHAALLVEAGWHVTAYDPLPTVEALPNGVVRARSRDEALATADIAVVATPTAYHLDDALAAVRAGCHVLVEKPLATGPEGVDELAVEAEASERVVAVAMSLRFHPGPATVVDMVRSGSIGTPWLAEVSFGAYLPDWRPGVDYRTTYSARAELGGGVLLDVVHELDYVTWALGPAVEVSAWLDRLSDLEIDVEDTALIHLRHAAGARSSIALDYLDRSYRRTCRVVGSEGSVQWRAGDERVVRFGPTGVEESRPAPSGLAAAYRVQTAAFLGATRRGTVADTPLVGIPEALTVLKMIAGLRQSSFERRSIRLG